MRRLYLHVYLVVVASLTLLVIILATFWHMYGARHFAMRPLDGAAELAELAFPPGARSAEQQATLERLIRPPFGRISLFDADRRLIAHAGAPLPPPPPDAESGWASIMPEMLPAPEDGARDDAHEMGERPMPHMSTVLVLHLNDGRWLVAETRKQRLPSPQFHIVLLLAIVALVVAIAAFPAVRHLTRRVELLKQAVDRFGDGDLSVRVPVRGKDEIAALTQSFNQSAARIQGLMTAHRQLLANASHELRSPLARIRLALEMLGKNDAEQKLRDEVRRNVGELDQLVEEILLASRLEAHTAQSAETATAHEPVDLTVLLAEECARLDVPFETGEILGNAPADAPDLASNIGQHIGHSAASIEIRGDARLLRRMVRNLLENARRHGGDEVAAELSSSASGIRIAVMDRGPGVPESERERIFEPFYRPAGTREREGGWGLGLSLVRQIAARHGGTVQCLPRDGGGSVFVVGLPVSEVLPPKT